MKKRREEGGLLIILMVWVAIMTIFAGVAYQAWSITWRRDNEEELIFRGHQYVDALILYRKEHNKQFPANLDDLMKPGPRQVRYIRKLFRDPMTHNGKWGLLYLMPGGAAIYDPVAAQKGQAQAADQQGGPVSDDARIVTPGATPGVTPIGVDPNGAMGGFNAASLMGGSMGLGNPAGGRGVGGTGVPGGAGGAGGAGAAAMARAGGVAAVGQPPPGMTLPPPKPASDADADSASEPPIGWPVVGVISRVTGKWDEEAYKIYQGHDHVSEWQFHAFEHPLDQGQAPTGTMPSGNGGCVGPGYGGCGPIGGLGGGPDGGGGPGRNSPLQRGINPGQPGGPRGGGPGRGPGMGNNPGNNNQPPP